MALYIHWQNHNYAVDPATLPEGVEVTHRNLNDGSCAGLAFPAQRIMSLQYHLRHPQDPMILIAHMEDTLFIFLSLDWEDVIGLEEQQRHHL
ncbi:hypothetical protein AAZV13_16G077900 [Glycine max]